jgi:hypothetical protein
MGFSASNVSTRVLLSRVAAVIALGLYGLG